MDDSTSRPRVIITTKSGAAANANAGADSSSGVSITTTSSGRRQIRTKGRGFRGAGGSENADRYDGKGGEFERIQEEEEGASEAQKCKEQATTEEGRNGLNVNRELFCSEV